jgi:hypothetical protein
MCSAPRNVANPWRDIRQNGAQTHQFAAKHLTDSRQRPAITETAVFAAVSGNTTKLRKISLQARLELI